MDDDNDKAVVMLGCGLLSPIFDCFDVRQPLPRQLSECEFNKMVADLAEAGRIDTTSLECDWYQ